MTCSCQADGGRHHHSFGGTYPCECPEPCEGCGDKRAIREARETLEYAVPHEQRRETR